MRRLVAGLAVTQTVGYGALYYAFAVVLVPIAEELRAPAAAVAGALTLSTVVSAIVAVPVGRWLDRQGGRWLMTGGSLLGAAALVEGSQVHQIWQLYAVFVLIGLSSAACLYEAAFAVIIATSSTAARNRALLTVTVVAGFASTIFFPLTGLLVQHLGWRAALLVLAAVLAVLTVPVHAIFVPDQDASVRPADRTAAPSSTAHRGQAVRRALSDPGFWRLAAAFVAHTAAVASVGVLLVSYLRQAGHPPTVAASLAGLLGVLSVAGRLVSTGFAARYGMAAVAAVVFAVQAIGVAGLPHVGASLIGAIACVAAFGVGFGVATIARPAIVADRYGTSRYATITAAITLPVTLAKAAAPAAAAALPPTPFLTTAAVFCVAAALLLWPQSSRRWCRPRASSPSTVPRASARA